MIIVLITLLKCYYLLSNAHMFCPKVSKVWSQLICTTDSRLPHHPWYTDGNTEPQRLNNHPKWFS